MKKSSNCKGFHIMAKPVGAYCNINCTYCFYLEKQSFYENNKLNIMSYDVLEKFVKEYISINNAPEIQFVWQGGEPMLAGLDFYKNVVKLQAKYSNGKVILNSLQTNGVLLDDEWCNFLKFNNFFVGISIDGPKDITDIYRKDKADKPMFESIFKGVELLKKYSIPFSALACVTNVSAKKPLEVYDFFKNNGINHFQFTPVVERIPTEKEKSFGLENSSPLSLSEDFQVTDWSVSPGEYGKFLSAIFDKWSEEDIGKIFVQNFEWALSSWMGLDSNVCIFSKSCSGCNIIEHNGDIYCCDHYVYPEFMIGNILEKPLDKIFTSRVQNDFSNMKKSLPKKCIKCPALFACQGECPRHRFVWNKENSEFESYLCDDYRQFFEHIHPKTKAMAQLISNGLPASDLVKLKNGPIVLYKQ